MPDMTSDNQNPNLPPPGGYPSQAEKYINQLISLIDKDKLNVSHTDLSKFDPSTLQDHYRLELRDYQVEVSHSKHPDSGKDSYIILFTNIKNHLSGDCEKIILAFMHLDVNQFLRFKKVSLNQLDKKRRAEEEKRLKAALEPVDLLLEDLNGDSHHQIPAVS